MNHNTTQAILSINNITSPINIQVNFEGKDYTTWFKGTSYYEIDSEYSSITRNGFTFSGKINGAVKYTGSPEYIKIAYLNEDIFYGSESFEVRGSSDGNPVDIIFIENEVYAYLRSDYNNHYISRRL